MGTIVGGIERCEMGNEDEGRGIRDGVKVVLRRTRSVGGGGIFERLGMMDDEKDEDGNAGRSSRGRLLISRFAFRRSVWLQCVSF
jgi:hypothetical protein